MGEPKVGDKLFLYGQFLRNLEEFGDYEYNALMGYQTIGGYFVELKKSEISGASVPGFVVNFPFTPCLTPETPFSRLEDVTDELSLQSPTLSGTKVWTMK